MFLWFCEDASQTSRSLKLAESVALSYIWSINLHFYEISFNSLYTKPGGLQIYSRNNSDSNAGSLCVHSFTGAPGLWNLKFEAVSYSPTQQRVVSYV